MCSYGNKVKQGFTLMEMVLVLMIMGVILQASLSLIVTYQKTDEIIEKDRQAEGYLWLNVLQEDLKHFTIQEVYSDFLLIQRVDSQEVYTIILKEGVIYKTPGYQPYLYGVSAWRLEALEDCLYVEILFDNEETFYGYLFTAV